ncbi:MAG: hypothetical protein QOG04_99, partial [Actinomycetota bacterium]|nr:hypothetical protein [Actinomycetota bacterium]
MAYVVSHPIQYQAPLLRRIAREPDIDLHVYFLSDLSSGGYRDPGFGTWIEWDVPLTEGYEHTFLSTTKEVSRGGPLRSELRAGHFDAVWIHGYKEPAARVAIAAARSNGIAVLLRGESHLGLVHGLLARWYRRVVLPAVFARADGFLAIGGANRDFYRRYGVNDDKIHLMPYAVDNEFFSRAAREAGAGRAALRAELGIGDNTPVILFASKITHVKGADVLIEGFRQLRRDTDAHLLLVGDGDLRAALEARGDPDVTFVGFKNQSELPKYYDLCDVFVLPSRWEPWGLVINEAMNAAKPIVTTDVVGAARDLVQEGISGRVVRAGDPVALA